MWSRRTISRSPFIAVIVLGLVMVCIPATTSPANGAAADQIRIVYEQPRNPAHAPIRSRLSERRVLELLRDFLSPLKLPRTLTIKTASCGRENAFYDSRNQTVTLCYELIVWIHAMIPAGSDKHNLTREDAIIAAVIDTILHETAHAIFHILDLPILGNEELAADQIAALILLQFGEDVARLTVTGTAILFQNDVKRRRDEREKTAPKGSAPSDSLDDTRSIEFSGLHGLPEQRYYNLLCIAYGRHRKAFADFVNDGKLPTHRARRCQAEYEQVAKAYCKLIEPHVDPALRDKVLQRDWISEIRGMGSGVSAPLRARPCSTP
jgi:hypothetical protein